MKSAIGKMDARITLQRAVDVVDLQGSVSQQWENVATVWAEVTPVAAAEATNGNARTATTAHTFKIRYQRGFAGLNPIFRIIWNDGIWDISGSTAMPVARPDSIVLTAVRVAVGADH